MANWSQYAEPAKRWDQYAEDGPQGQITQPQAIDPVRKRQEILAGRAAAQAEAAQAQAGAARGILGAFPQAVGGIGGIAGPIGAGVGGGVGKAIEQTGLVLAGEQTPQAGLQAVGNEAIAQAGGALVGGGVGKVLGRIGGTITGRVIRERASQARGLYARATEAGLKVPTRVKLKQATQAGTRIPGHALLRGIPELMNEASLVDPDVAQGVARYVRRFASNKMKPLTPLRLHDIRMPLDRAGGKVHKAIGKGGIASDIQDYKARAQKIIADNARTLLRDALPQSKKVEARLARAIGQRRAVPFREGPLPTNVPSGLVHGGLATLGGSVGGVPGFGAGALAAYLLTQPSILKSIGAGIDNPLIMQLLQQSGRTIGGAVNQ